MIDPQKTTMLGKPIGDRDLGVSTWNGDEWKIGGGTTWGWYTYDPELNLIYYGTGNPGTWNPAQRAKDGKREGSDNKWSMSIFARDADTGAVKWVFQKTPFDEWDYDGVNENILADITVKGKPVKALVNFLLWMGAGLADATDIAQETMIEAYRNWPSIQQPRAWTRRVASRQYGRRRYGQEMATDPEDLSPLLRAPADIAAWEQRHEVLRLLATLPWRQRQVMAWTFDGYQSPEIADELKITPEAVRASLKLARRALAEGLGQAGETE